MPPIPAYTWGRRRFSTPAATNPMIKVSGNRLSPTEIEEAAFASGAVVEALAIGVLEKLFEIYWGQPLLGGNTETWFAFVLALLVLLFRPQGLFGERIIERV